MVVVVAAAEVAAATATVTESSKNMPRRSGSPWPLKTRQRRFEVVVGAACSESMTLPLA